MLDAGARAATRNDFSLERPIFIGIFENADDRFGG
jgi:hypothetical protein